MKAKAMNVLRANCFIGVFIKVNCSLLEQISNLKFKKFWRTALNRVNNFFPKGEAEKKALA
ncbi:hypothetical protein GCM10023229_21710 [Flavisolibacter ginsenosidimutans]